MRYAIISDVHSNLEALEAVLGSLEDEKIDGYLSTGDIVGYGADPGPCIERIRALDPHIVAGNHDWAVAGLLSLDFFNAYAREAIEWTRGRLGKAEIEWLRSLKLVKKVGRMTLAHATLHSPENFDYLLTAYDAHRSASWATLTCRSRSPRTGASRSPSRARSTSRGSRRPS